MKRVWIPQVTVSLMLLWALSPTNPYSYYTFLRIICCGSFVYLATLSNQRKTAHWQWVFVGLAVIYNPIFRIHLDRPFWSVVNVATVAVLLFSINKIPTEKQE